MQEQPYSVLVIQTLDNGQRVQVSRCHTALDAWSVAVRLSQERPGNYWVLLEADPPKGTEEPQGSEAASERISVASD